MPTGPKVRSNTNSSQLSRRVSSAGRNRVRTSGRLGARHDSRRQHHPYDIDRHHQLRSPSLASAAVAIVPGYGQLDLTIAIPSFGWNGLVERFGEPVYKIAFSIVALAGFALIVYGYGKLYATPGKNPEIWSPPNAMRHASMLLMLPALIAETGLLSFISRHHLDAPDGRSPLKEVAIKETTMHRRLVVTYRESSYLMPAARMLIELLQDAAPNGKSRGGKFSG